MTSTSNKELKLKYRRMRSAVKAAIDRADPLGLLEVGSPDDEYDPEIGTILPRLSEANSRRALQTILYEEFVEWFGEKNAGKRKQYAASASEIWNMLQDEKAV